MSATQLGRYRLLDRLGQGGMATVYRASDPQLGRDVAVKVMHPFIAEGSHRTEAARRFEREARAVAGLRHPNVMQLHDYHPAEGERPAYLVMELLSGPSLRAFLDKNGTPFAEVGAIIGLRVAQALEAAHASGIIHRDVKPENVMFDLPSGLASGLPPGSAARVVLCDFGIARLATEGQTMTATGAVIGSPVFMSPEQARGEPIDARSDLFSLGSLLYTLATGSPPFVAADGAHQPLVIMNKIAKGEHRPPTAKNPRVPRWLERAIERCLALDPAERFQSASALIEALGDGLRADGLGDFDGELTSYLRDPPAYNERLAERVIASTLEQQRQAVAKKQRARALSAASRILAWQPDHAEALAVVDQFDHGAPKWWWLGGAAAVVVALGGGGWLALRPHATATPAPHVVSAPNVTAVAPSPLAPPPVAVEAALIKPPAVESRHKKLPRAAVEATPAPAVVVAVAAPAALPTVREKPPEEPPAEPKEGELTVAIKPWCDLTVDGKAIGRAPLTVKLAAGPHHVECRQPSGAGVTRDLVIRGGQSEVLRENLFGAVTITPRLGRGVQFAVDEGAPGAGARQITPGRHRFIFYRDGQAAEPVFLDVRPEGCRLVDSPEPACEKP